MAAEVGSLSGKVALVTGASRGLGKGIALGLGEAGATVYVTGRSTEERGAVLPGSIGATAAEVTRLGGEGVAVRCDHRLDGEVEALFARVAREQGRLDILVNNAFASPEQRTLWGGQRFWQIPLTLWDDLIDVRLRSHFVATWYAAPLMIEQGSGLVVNVASHGAATGKSAKSRVILPYSVGKAALHRLSADMSVELRDSGVAVVSIWPPATRTEGVFAQEDVFGDVSDWRPPLFTGRVVGLRGRGGLARQVRGSARRGRSRPAVARERCDRSGTFVNVTRSPSALIPQQGKNFRTPRRQPSPRGTSGGNGERGAETY